MITNWPSLIASLISVACLLVYIVFLTPKQFGEVLRPRDWLTGLRWIILLILIISIVTAIPSLIYQTERALGHEYHILRNVSTVLGQISKLGTTILLVMVYSYKQRD